MKNSILLMLLFTGMVEAQIVTIPDANFKAYLLNATATPNQIAQDQFDNPMVIDADGDGNIQNSEAEAVYALTITASSTIESVEGIVAFTNLKTIVFNSVTQLSALDLSGLSNLVNVYISNNDNLLSVNLSGLLDLKILYCMSNFALTSINLTGLNNLETFTGYGNRFTSLDLSDLDSLQYLDCSYNNLTSLNVTGLSQLAFLNFEANTPLISVNLSGLPLLAYNSSSFSMSNNNLQDVAISDCPLFTTIDIYSTNLVNFTCNLPGLTNLFFNSGNIVTVNLAGCSSLLAFAQYNCTLLNSLNLSGCTALKIISIPGNSLTTIDLSECLALENVKILSSQITEIDFSTLTHLTALDISYNTLLRRVFMKNGSIESNPNFFGLNNLEFVCADDAQIGAVDTLLSSIGFDYVVVNSYCSFVPGGNHNTITGDIKFDANNNGCDSNDIVPMNLRVNINDGTNQGGAFTNNTGNYSFYTQAGSFNITPSAENPTWFNFLPSTATIPFADNNNNTATQDFCIAANGIHPDVEVVVAPITPARPGFDAVYKIVYRNKGNQTITGNITFTYDDAVLDFVNATMVPDIQNTGLLNWNYSNLLPFENRSFYITLNVNGSTETPAVNIGDALHFEATITPVIGDEIPVDNSFVYNQTVVGSYDPNDITCLEGDVVAPSEIGNYLHYAINFENTGIFPAENVVVKTDVDPTKFDIDSLQLMNSNFPVDARITGNKVEFIFKNINLGIGGHGHILLKIKTKNTLVTGDTVANRGDIFFDYNAPIDTGLANTVFQALSNTDFDIDNSVVVAPNPASNEVVINAGNNIKSIQLYDAQGRIISDSLVKETETKLDISSYCNGIYFIKIKTEKGSKVEKMVKK